MPDASHPPPVCEPVDDRCGATEVCGNGMDDDCNGRVDEGCACDPGAVQPCFAGPPGRRDVGACRDGAQTCDLSGTWGECAGGIVPRDEPSCDGTDNLCNGCTPREHCPVACPGPGDSRVPDGAPFQNYALHGRDFATGPVRAWHWSAQGGPCDAFSANRSFRLTAPDAQDTLFVPNLSGDYTITLQVTGTDGDVTSCSWVVHVAGPGLRVEMCYPESDHLDLDLYLHRPGSTQDWYPPGYYTVYTVSPDVCSWSNCEGHIRGAGATRADWGYANTALINCQHGPFGGDWTSLGYCANPRLDIDNNLQEGRGLPENINVDDPRDGESFRIMIQNFTGYQAHPVVNVYCGGRREATYGAAPNELPDFHGAPGSVAIGAMWRVADVTVHVDATGATTGCDVRAIHPAGMTRGYDVTQDDPSY